MPKLEHILPIVTALFTTPFLAPSSTLAQEVHCGILEKRCLANADACTPSIQIQKASSLLGNYSPVNHILVLSKGL
ncbi:hypothetical protein [Leptolyngbya ohadii]|uniref:hypothetical protein n=1 Tax=Leptolyngbya ohadii TaxID=1962290 RepID=UPI001179BCA1|nr:hypothetical protein [Leptolyngbya ohadii]